MWLPVSIGLAAVIGVGIVGGRFLRPGTPEAQVDVREVAIVEITPRTPSEVPPAAPQPLVGKKQERPEAPKEVARPEPEVARSEEPPAPEPPKRSGESGALSISTDQPDRTFVYLDGGTLLGEAPLRNAAVPAGKHTLVFWTPSVGGRSRRTVHVAPGENVEVVERVRSSESFSDEPTVSPSQAPG